jgi:DNA-binding GntR family transcriptional regulator
MSPGAVIADHVYENLKRAIIAGRFRPGTALPVPQLARELGTSVSPVRDAMARLCGEKLLAFLPGGGFERPALTEKALQDLHRWHAHLLRLALREKRSGWTLEPSDDFDILSPTNNVAIAEATATLFCAIAECSNNKEHVDAIRSATDRLHATRLAETDIPDRLEELRMVADAVAHGSSRTARAAIGAYERRRLRRIRKIVLAAGGTIAA